MGKPLIAFLCGLVFAAGLGVAQMTQPKRVIGFLDFFHDWDPTLMFVMGGAIAVYLPVWWLFRGRKAPIGGATIPRKLRNDVDKRLVIGATLFGIGWGLVGVCPGPGVVLLARPNTGTVVFVGAMLTGMLIFNALPQRRLLASK